MYLFVFIIFYARPFTHIQIYLNVLSNSPLKQPQPTRHRRRHNHHQQQTNQLQAEQPANTHKLGIRHDEARISDTPPANVANRGINGQDANHQNQRHLDPKQPVPHVIRIRLTPIYHPQYANDQEHQRRYPIPQVNLLQPARFGSAQSLSERQPFVDQTGHQREGRNMMQTGQDRREIQHVVSFLLE